MRILQIAACVFCIWLVLGRQEARLRLLARPPGTCSGCCLNSISDDTFSKMKKALKSATQRSEVYVENIEGTTIYVLTEPFWTEQQEQQTRKKLWKAAAGFFETPNIEIRLIDEGSFGGSRWQAFAGIVGLLLLTVAAQIHSRRKARS